ncbi:MAG TPA: hypothetical protein VK836_12005 [Streptosporangiaceae bacterium]|jgi:hypothetical protein|nr:hypothetical protein [Streptosporangiaceae bacterium]
MVVGAGPPSAARLAAAREAGSAIRGSLADDAVADWTVTGALLPEAAGVGASGGWVGNG